MRSRSPLRVLIVAHQTADPAVQDAINVLGFDEVIVSILPARVSRWLHLDLPRKVRALGIPVIEVIDNDHRLSDISAA